MPYKGQRCHAAIPHGHWKTVTFVGGLTLAGFIAPMLLDEAIVDGEVFEAGTSEMLATRPALRPGDIVIMDNLAAHNGQAERMNRQARKHAVQRCSTCRPTVPISIRSRMPSPSSRPTFEKQPHELSKLSKPQQLTPFKPSNQPTAQTRNSLTQTWGFN